MILLLAKDLIKVCQRREEIIHIPHVLDQGIEIDDECAYDRLNSNQLPQSQLPGRHERGCDAKRSGLRNCLPSYGPNILPHENGKPGLPRFNISTDEIVRFVHEKRAAVSGFQLQRIL